MKVQSFLALLVIMLLVTSSVADLYVADAELLSSENLSFQADIYGDAGPETIEYKSDLQFHSAGGFGTNAHIYLAHLRSGDGIAYAISADDPYAYTLQVATEDGVPKILTVTNADYSAGMVTMPSSNELRFTWDILQSGLHAKLHRHVTLQVNPNVTAEHVVQEVFTVENLGPPFTLISLSEYLHMDDRALAEDFDCDGIAETLLAINSYSSTGYPVFGKLYRQQENRLINMSISDNFATVNTQINGGLGVPISETHGELELMSASYVSSTGKDEDSARQQIASDVSVLLGLAELPNRWLLRSYNTDDRGAAFINGLMVIGSRYSLYPDSGWTNVCKHWRGEGDNYVSFASWDIGVCCGATYGFGIKQNDEVLWSEEGSGPADLGLAYARTLRVSSSGEISDHVPPVPPDPLDGNWEVSIRANSGFAFVLVNQLPVTGSTNNVTQTVAISHLLGRTTNHIHLNTWDDGLGNHEWFFTIRRDGAIVWENEMSVSNGPRGRSHHMQLVIDEHGKIYPLLDLPIDYNERPTGASYGFYSAFNSRITAVFDHRFPRYGDGNAVITPYTGLTYSNPHGSDECSPNPMGCYDEHDAYDFDDLCPTYAPCLERSAVYPAADGEINEDETGWDRALGCKITIDHGNGWQTVYAHLDGPGENEECPGLLIDSGAVSRFDKLARIGCSGSGCRDNATHLHFVVRDKGVAVDPSGWHLDPQIIPDPWANDAGGQISLPMWQHEIGTRTRLLQGYGGSLASEDHQLTVNIPPGFHNEPLTFGLSNSPVNTEDRELVFSGLGFSLTAVNDRGEMIDELATAFSVRVKIDSVAIHGIRPSTLSVYSWDGDSKSWSAVPTSVDFSQLVVTAEMKRLSAFALMGEPLAKSFVPVLVR